MYNVEYYTEKGEFIAYYYGLPTRDEIERTCDLIQNLVGRGQTIYISKVEKEYEEPLSPGVFVMEKD